MGLESQSVFFMQTWEEISATRQKCNFLNYITYIHLICAYISLLLSESEAQASSLYCNLGVTIIYNRSMFVCILRSGALAELIGFNSGQCVYLHVLHMWCISSPSQLWRIEALHTKYQGLLFLPDAGGQRGHRNTINHPVCFKGVTTWYSCG